MKSIEKSAKSGPKKDLFKFESVNILMGHTVGSIWHFLKKSGEKILAVSCRIVFFFTRFELILGRKLGKIAMSYQMLMLIKHPDFLCKCQIQSIS